ncbi:MAG TPA: iron ABC transporter permease [Devosia sp.]|nr:iron ABC transporter permease [Devosia sp.]
MTEASSLAATPPAAMAWKGLRAPFRSRLVQWGMFLFTIVLIVGPLFPLVYQSFTDKALYDTGQSLTLENYANVFASSSFRTAATNSLIYACLATIVSQVIGALQAVLLERTNIPGRRIIGLFVLWPLFISPLVTAFGWSILYGGAGYITSFVKDIFGNAPWNLQSLMGMAVIGGILNAPITLLYCRGAIALSDPSMEDAARSCGAPPLTIIRRITLPLLGPAIIFSGMINFIGALETLSIPLIFGEPAGITLLMPLLYNQALGTISPDYGLVAAASMLLLGIVVLLLILQSRLVGDPQRYRSVSGKASRKTTFDIGVLRWPAAIFMGAYVTAFIILPMAAIFLRGFVSVLTPLIPIWEVFTLDNFYRLIEVPRLQRAFVNSTLLAAVGGALIAGLAGLVTLICYRSDFRFRGLLRFVAMIPQAVPGMIAGIAFLYTVLMVPGLAVLTTTLFIFVVAYAGRFLPVALGAIYPTLTQIGPDLDRSARTMGADWWFASRRILLPLMMPALMSAYILIFVQTMREYTVALFLVAPGTEVISITMLRAWAQGDVGIAAVMSAAQTMIIALFLIVTRRLNSPKRTA